MNELIIIGIICAIGLVMDYITEHGGQIARDIKGFIKWNLEKF